MTIKDLIINLASYPQNMQVRTSAYVTARNGGTRLLLMEPNLGKQFTADIACVYDEVVDDGAKKLAPQELFVRLDRDTHI